MMKRPLLGRRSIGFALLFLALVLLPILLGRLSKGKYYMHIAILILLYVYLATAWNLLGGYAGQHSLGNALYLGTGAYVSTLLFLRLGITPWLGMWLAGAAAALLGWFVGFVCFRYGLRGGYFALVTIALAEGAEYLVTNVRSIGGARGLEVTWMGHRPLLMQFDGKTGYYYVILAMAALAIAYTAWVDRRRLGYYLVAVRENERAADALGADPVKIKVQANVLSAFLTGIGGTFFAQYYTYIHPSLVFGEGPSVEIMLFAIIGGLGTVWGPSVGALILVPIAEFTRAQLGGSFAGASLLLYGAVLMVVMLFMPYGILGALRRVKQGLAGEDKPATSEASG
jgi:branched-chain amino acid transport system permease protein